MSRLCLQTIWIWIEALLASMRFRRTQIGELQIWADWECGWLLPLVVLALSGSEKALQCLLSQLLRYSFCTISWTRIERLTLTHHECEQLFFPHRLTLHHLLCYQIDACGNSQKGHLGFSVYPFMTYHFYCSQGYAQECAQTHTGLVLHLAVLPLEAFQKTTLLHPGWHWRKGKSSQAFNGEELNINLGCHQVYPCCISTPPPW